MSLVLGAGAYCNWIEASPVLSALGLDKKQERITDSELSQLLASQQSFVLESADRLQLLSQHIESYPNLHVVLFYSDLADTLVYAVANEQNIDESITEWKQGLIAIQDFYRKHRKQTLLFELQQVLKHPQLFVDTCATQWQHTVRTVDLTPQANDTETWAVFLARQILAYDSELNYVVKHTKAMTWPLGASDDSEQDDEAGIMAVLQKLQSQPTIHKESQETIVKKEENDEEMLKLRQENQLTLDQLLVIQEELEKQILKVQKSQQEITTLRSSHTQSEQQKDALNTAVTDLKARLQESEKQVKSLEQSIEQLETEKKDSSHENQLLLEQVFVLQEEVEKHFFETKNEQELLERQILEFQNRRLSQ